MKSRPSISFLVLFIAIIFSIIVSVPLIEGKTVWIQNKLVFGTIAQAVACNNENCDHEYDRQWSTAHDSFSLGIPDDASQFWVIFSAKGTIEDEKIRGPFDNTQDICWHYHGSLDYWIVYPCP
ncbi:18390_t:CDS:2 [Dentiscutata erythropus]|uniref:18390_t:CDS:1 n=1 Tax=Dentiscutata erythropus TaxID=1348616 RepID=A0A9N9N3Z7_9GLOM|nr:18390_t:CDS:2 [Dentiscutata erythropus]